MAPKKESASKQTYRRKTPLRRVPDPMTPLLRVLIKEYRKGLVTLTGDPVSDAKEMLNAIAQ